MKIERILRSSTGSLAVPMGGKVYNFKALFEDGPQVAEVKDERHAEVFLSIREGYREYEGPEDEDAPQPQPLPPLDVREHQSMGTAAPVKPEVVFGGLQRPQGDVTDTTNLDAAVTDNVGGLDKLTDDELRALFRDEVGRTANAKASKETLIAQIEAVRAENAKKDGKE